ncbi:hypothetical protein MMC31_003632 [Peltigera leucophlebia]|nr:hypothetical protein [Peltigera leucophlebia]
MSDNRDSLIPPASLENTELFPTEKQDRVARTMNPVVFFLPSFPEIMELSSSDKQECEAKASNFRAHMDPVALVYKALAKMPGNLTPRSVLPSPISPSTPCLARESRLMSPDMQLLGSKSLSSSKDKEDESFSMSLLIISETRFSWKPHGEDYLEMSFAEFVEPLDISDANRIWWSRSSSSLINGQDLSVDDKDEYNGMISKLRRSKIPQHIFLVISPKLLGIGRLSNDNHSIHARVETAPPSPSVVEKFTTDFLANGKTFKSVTALNKFTETFLFGPDCLVVQIDAIEQCKQSASRSSRVYEKIAKNFLMMNPEKPRTGRLSSSLSSSSLFLAWRRHFLT